MTKLRVHEVAKSLDKSSKELLKKYFDKLKLSARAYSRILKVARTIADLDNKDNINEHHILEAIFLSRGLELEK